MKLSGWISTLGTEGLLGTASMSVTLEKDSNSSELAEWFHEGWGGVGWGWLALEGLMQEEGEGSVFD